MITKHACHLRAPVTAAALLLGVFLSAGQAQPVTITSLSARIAGGYTTSTLTFDRVITAEVQASRTPEPWIEVAAWRVNEASSLTVAGLAFDGVPADQLFFRVVPSGTALRPLAIPVAIRVDPGYLAAGATAPFAYPTGTVGPGHVTLAWDASPDASVTGYAILQGTSSGTWPVRIDVGTALTVRVSNLLDAATYFWVAIAYTAEGVESLPSNEVSANIAPGSPFSR